MSRVHDESEVPFRVDESRELKVNVKTLIAIIGATALATWSWYSIKSDVTSQAHDIQTIQANIKDIRDDLRIVLRRSDRASPSNSAISSP